MGLYLRIAFRVELRTVMPKDKNTSFTHRTLGTTLRSDNGDGKQNNSLARA